MDVFAVRDQNSGSKLPGPGEKVEFLILSSEPVDPHRKMLDNLIGAVGLEVNTNAMALEVRAENGFRLAPFCRDSNIRRILLFGLRPDQVGLQVDHTEYLSLNIANFQFIFAASLSKIDQNKQLKLQLWNGLKAMFEV